MITFSPVMRNHQLDAYNLKSNYRKLKYLFTCGQLVAKKNKTQNNKLSTIFLGFPNLCFNGEYTVLFCQARF